MSDLTGDLIVSSSHVRIDKCRCLCGNGSCAQFSAIRLVDKWVDKKRPLSMHFVGCGNQCVSRQACFLSGIIMSCHSLYSVFKGPWYEPRVKKRNLNLLDNYFKPRINIIVSDFPEQSQSDVSDCYLPMNDPDFNITCQPKVFASVMC